MRGSRILVEQAREQFRSEAPRALRAVARHGLQHDIETAELRHSHQQVAGAGGVDHDDLGGIDACCPAEFMRQKIERRRADTARNEEYAAPSPQPASGKAGPAARAGTLYPLPASAPARW